MLPLQAPSVDAEHGVDAAQYLWQLVGLAAVPAGTPQYRFSIWSVKEQAAAARMGMHCASCEREVVGRRPACTCYITAHQQQPAACCHAGGRQPAADGACGAAGAAGGRGQELGRPGAYEWDAAGAWEWHFGVQRRVDGTSGQPG